MCEWTLSCWRLSSPGIYEESSTTRISSDPTAFAFAIDLKVDVTSFSANSFPRAKSMWDMSLRKSRDYVGSELVRFWIQKDADEPHPPSENLSPESCSTHSFL